MTAKDTERIAKLEATVGLMLEEVRSGREDIQTLQKTMDELSGGKQALMWVTGITLTITGIIVAFLNFKKK